MCGEFFTTTKRKVTHHRRGTGEFLNVVCDDCNKKMHLPKYLPVFFHNGGGYDFHFILRAIARLTNRAPQLQGFEMQADGAFPDVEHTEEDEEREKREDEERFQEDTTYEDVSVTGQNVDFSRLRFGVLARSGENYMQVTFGPLRFLDSMRFFDCGLDKLIKERRGSFADPAEAFPLLAERHPRFAEAQARGDEAWRRRVWELLLQKIPMPFGAMQGPGYWDRPALLERSEYFDALSGKPCAEAKYQLIEEIVATCDFPDHILEACCRPKMYSLLTAKTVKLRAKGVPRRALQAMSHEDYRAAQEEPKKQMITFNRLTSLNHVPEIRAFTKRGISNTNAKVHRWGTQPTSRYCANCSACPRRCRTASSSSWRRRCRTWRAARTR